MLVIKWHHLMSQKGNVLHWIKPMSGSSVAFTNSFEQNTAYFYIIFLYHTRMFSE